jgi:hypothetical protein
MRRIIHEHATPRLRKLDQFVAYVLDLAGAEASPWGDRLAFRRSPTSRRSSA